MRIISNIVTIISLLVIFCLMIPSQVDTVMIDKRKSSWYLNTNCSYLNVPNDKINVVGWQLGGGVILKNNFFIRLNGGALYKLNDIDTIKIPIGRKEIPDNRSYQNNTFNKFESDYGFYIIQKFLIRGNLHLGYIKTFKQNYFVGLYTGFSYNGEPFQLYHITNPNYYALHLPITVSYGIIMEKKLTRRFYLLQDLNIRPSRYFSFLYQMGLIYYLSNGKINTFNVKDSNQHRLKFSLGTGTSIIHIRYYGVSSFSTINHPVPNIFSGFFQTIDYYFQASVGMFSARALYKVFTSHMNNIYLTGPTKTLSYFLIGVSNKNNCNKVYLSYMLGKYFPGFNFFAVKYSNNTYYIGDYNRFLNLLIEFGFYPLKNRKWDISCFVHRLGQPLRIWIDSPYERNQTLKQPINVQTSIGISLNYNIKI